jgi:hypothetical protein
VIDAEVIVKVKGLVLCVRASEPSALDLGRLLDVGAALLNDLPGPADAKEEDSNKREEDDDAHVCCPWLWCGVVV